MTVRDFIEGLKEEGFDLDDDFVASYNVVVVRRVLGGRLVRRELKFDGMHESSSETPLSPREFEMQKNG